MPYKDPEKKKAYAREYMRNYYRGTENGKRLARESNKRLAERRRKILEELKSVPCSDCGNKYPVYVMDFHHREGEEKIRGVSHMTSVSAIIKEAQKCDVVCANCHRIRTWKEKYGNGTY